LFIRIDTRPVIKNHSGVIISARGQAAFNLATQWPRPLAAKRSLYVWLEFLERSLELWFPNPVKDSQAASGQPLPQNQMTMLQLRISTLSNSILKSNNEKNDQKK
jgi:hypothetical protein